MDAVRIRRGTPEDALARPRAAQGWRERICHKPWSATTQASSRAPSPNTMGSATFTGCRIRDRVPALAQVEHRPSCRIAPSRHAGVESSLDSFQINGVSLRLVLARVDAKHMRHLVLAASLGLLALACAQPDPNLSRTSQSNQAPSRYPPPHRRQVRPPPRRPRQPSARR